MVVREERSGIHLRPPAGLASLIVDQRTKTIDISQDKQPIRAAHATRSLGYVHSQIIVTLTKLAQRPTGAMPVQGYARCSSHVLLEFRR